jgi:hypothetical protein
VRDADPWRLTIDEMFRGPDLDSSLWLPYYLPQWASREHSAARVGLGDGGLILRIDPDQEPWNPELDPGIRVSSLQTGAFSGPLGSRIGQHHFRLGLTVREQQARLALFTPIYGRFEVRMATNPDPDMLTTLWMIGFEDEPERSGEICVVEAFGRDAGVTGSAVGVGIHPFGDPSLVDDFELVRVPIDTRGMHDYAVEWLPDCVRWFVDGIEVKRTTQSPAYPMQFMLGLYELPLGTDATRRESARAARIERFRGWERDT